MMHAANSPTSTPRAIRRSSAQAAAVVLASGIAAAALLGPMFCRPALRIVWNVSASVPLGLYRIRPNAPLGRGDFAVVRPSPSLARFMADRRYVEANALLVKPVAAISGQRVCRIGLVVTIDHNAVASALPSDRRGRPLPVWRGCQRLSADALFLLAPAISSSFDGRYFGPTPGTQVVGRAVPVLTW